MGPEPAVHRRLSPTIIPGEPVYIAGSGNNIQASGAYYGNTGWDGITYYSCPNAAVFVSPVNVYENDYYTNSYSARDAESVTTHEFGHALGLNHSYCGTLMYYGTGGGCRPNTPRIELPGLTGHWA